MELNGTGQPHPQPPPCDGATAEPPLPHSTTNAFEESAPTTSPPASPPQDAIEVVNAHTVEISPSRRPTAVPKPRPEPLDLPPINETNAFIVPAEEQAQQRQQQHMPPLQVTVPAVPAHRRAESGDTDSVSTSVSRSASASATSHEASNQSHQSLPVHKKTHKTVADIWFEYMIALSEVVFVTKLTLYEDSCALLLAQAVRPRRRAQTQESLLRSEKSALDILDRMQFRRPVKMRKQSGLIDAIEEEKEYVYEGLEEGYKVYDVDVDAVRHYGHRNGWLPPSNPASQRGSPLAPPPEALEKAAPHCIATQAPTPVPELQAGGSTTSASVGAGTAASPTGATAGSSSCDDECEVETTEEVIEHTLLYGELTALGVRQVIRLFHEAIMQDAAEDTYAQEYGTVVVGVDIGCGTGKMLFEWSRLAAAQVQSDYTERADRTPTENSNAAFPSMPGAGVGGAAFEAPAALQYTRFGGSWRGGPGAGSALGGSPASSLNARRQQHYLSRMPADLAPPENWSFSSAGVMPQPNTATPAPRSNMHGFLGFGIEVAPSRMFVARKAMSPNYLDLILTRSKRSSTDDGGSSFRTEHSDTPFTPAREPFAVGDPDSAEEAKKALRHHHSVAVSRSALPRYDPAPASAVAAPCPDPAKRRPAACVLLHEGDALSPGLLHNQTLFRFPPPNLLFNANAAALRGPASATAQFGNGSFGGALSLGGMAAGLPAGLRATHAPARENYYRLCRVQRAPPPTAHEVPHLNIFCCGIGFDETFVRALCTSLESLLQPIPPEEPHTTTTASEVLPHGDAAEMRRSMARDGPASLSRTMMPTTASSVTTLDKVTVAFPKLLRPSVLEHWKSITCVLLLRDFDVEETLKQPDFPLFSCCRRWHSSTRRLATTEATTSGERSASSTPAPQFTTGGISEGSIVGIPEVLGEYDDRSANVPGWCTSRAGLRDSSIRLTHVETTWMSKAPAWVLNFRF